MTSRRTVIGALAITVVVSSGAWAAGAKIQSPSTAAARAKAPTPSTITAPVELRRLAATTITRGDVLPRSATPVRVPTSVDGEPVITALDLSVGDEVTDGARAIEVAGRPVFVLEGVVPAYRTMRPGMSGPDIVQLQAALGRLGYRVDEDGYGPGTKGAVTALYASRGYDALTGAVGEGASLAAARRQVQEADDALSAAQRAMAAAGRGATDASIARADADLARAERNVALVAAQRDADVRQAEAEAAAADTRHRRLAADPQTDPDDLSDAGLERDRAAAAAEAVRREGDAAVADAADEVAAAREARAELVRTPDTTEESAAVRQAQASRDAATTELHALETSTGAVVPYGEIVFVPTTPATVESITTTAPAPETNGESGGAASGTLLKLSSGGLQVVASVRDTDLEAIRVGDTAVVLDEQSVEELDGTVASIGAEVTTSESGAEGHPVQIITADPIPPVWSGRNVRVTFTSAATTGKVLVVPLIAVSAGADGQPRVQRVDPGGHEHRVEVAAGLSADGFVEVRPQSGRLDRGDLVVVGR